MSKMFFNANGATSGAFFRTKSNAYKCGQSAYHDQILGARETRWPKADMGVDEKCGLVDDYIVPSYQSKWISRVVYH